MNPYEKKEPLLLISTDARLAHLLDAEARELCLGLHAERSFAALPAAHVSAASLLLWDTDTAPLTEDTLLPADLPVVVIGNGTLPAQLTPIRHLPRPFSVDQLRSTLRYLCERQPRKPSEGSALPALRLDMDALTLHVGAFSVPLTEKEAAIMALLMQHRGKAVSREQLHRAISKEEDGDRASNKVEVYLCHLRRKLEQPLGLRLFSTVRGQGYCLLTGYEAGKDEL